MRCLVDPEMPTVLRSPGGPLKTGGVVYTGVADSITSEDTTTWTVILEDGWTFHDGTPVTAQSFVDAWNYTAYSPNAQAASHFSANVAGYEDL